MWSQNTASKDEKKTLIAKPAGDSEDKRKQEADEEANDRFKREIIQDILTQIDYRMARRRGIVDLSQEKIAKDLEALPTRTLVAWYEAFLYIRSELMFAGYELNGLKILDRPADAIRKLMESDPNFDIRQYIF